MYCSNCEGTVHRTTKVCPHCGGDFTKVFGPNARRGEPPRKTPDPNHKYEPPTERQKKVGRIIENVIGYGIGLPVAAVTAYAVVKVIGWLGVY